MKNGWGAFILNKKFYVITCKSELDSLLVWQECATIVKLVIVYQNVWLEINKAPFGG